MKIVPDKYGFYTVYADDGCVLVNEKLHIVTSMFCAPSPDGWSEVKEADAPSWDEDDPSKGGLDPEQAWKIIESSNISKENKQKLYDYIYAKEELK